MRPLPSSPHPLVCALALAVLGSVSQVHAAWAPPTSTQPGSQDDTANDVPVTTTTAPASSPAGSASGGTLTVSSGGSYSSSSSYATTGTLTLNAGSYLGGSLSASASTLTLVGSNYYTGATSTLGGYFLTSNGTYSGSGTLLNGNAASTYNSITLVRGSTLDLKGSSLTLVNGGTYTPGTGVLSINGNTLTVDGSIKNFDDGSLLTLNQGGTLAFSDGTLTSTNGGISIFTLTSAFGLSGNLDNLSIKPNASSGLLHVKGTVTLHNSSNVSLKNVTATVYLSADNLLSADDAKLLTLSLSDLVEKGKIGKGKTLSLPLKHKVPSVYADYLDGKYLIVVLNADNLGSLASIPIVIGPLDAP